MHIYWDWAPSGRGCTHVMAHNNIICYLPRKCLVSLIQMSMNVQNIIIIIIELDLLIICIGQQHTNTTCNNGHGQIGAVI